MAKKLPSKSRKYLAVSKLYASPLRVYLLLAALAGPGIYSGLKLPISLFPNSSKPVVEVNIPYGSYAAEEFLNTFGKNLEHLLRNISTEKVEVEKVETTFSSRRARYSVIFKWGVKPTEALKETQN